jgi:hypothetical protein
MSIENTLKARGKTHGNFIDNSNVTQHLKRVIRCSKNWDTMGNVNREALDMICHKIGRICSGNPSEVDHWQDIAGYATLAKQGITGDLN